MSSSWTLSDIDWLAFDHRLVDRDILSLVKAAALVEYNADDYVSYLKSLFPGDSAILSDIEQWGREEKQHGQALAKWAQLADPSYDLEACSERFKQLFSLPESDSGSVRGSIAQELVARCVIETATSFHYMGLKEQAKEPVLKEIASRISRDEFGHYQWFMSLLEKLDHKPLKWQLIWTALTRLGEKDDDELAAAFFAANYPNTDLSRYELSRHSAAYTSRALNTFDRDKIRRMAMMIGRALEIDVNRFWFGHIQTGAAWSFEFAKFSANWRAGKRLAS